MWFKVQIKIQGDYSIYSYFTNKSYDSLNNISTISFEVFTPNLHHLYDKVINEYTDSHEFIKALEEYKIKEIPLKDLEDLHKFLKNTAMYKSSYLNGASPILDTGNKVFFNRDDAYWIDDVPLWRCCYEDEIEFRLEEERKQMELDYEKALI